MRGLLFILLAASLAGLGCDSTGKKPVGKPTGRDGPAPFWSEDNPKSGGAKAPAPEVDGMLAGMLIDSSGRAQPNATINVMPADAGPNAKPVGIQTDDNGYFMIRGLKTGTTYFLSARGEDRGKVLGGSTMTQAPNTRLLIRMSEGNVSSVTPAPEPHPATTGPLSPDKKKDGKTRLADPPTSNIPTPDPVSVPKDPLTGDGDTSWGPGKKSPANRPLPPPPPPPSTNPNIADMAKTWPPAATIPNPEKRIEAPPPPSSPSMSAVPSNSSPLGENTRQVNAQQVAFTLADVAGNPIEFRNLTDRRLIVLDFWSTTCMPCLRKIPDLIELQSRYSSYVEIVGVDCDNLPWAERKKAVAGIKDYYLRKSPRPINYPIYYEPEGHEGRVQNLFKVKAYPTMVLLDHSGRELWRGSDSHQLEDTIKYYLMRK